MAERPRRPDPARRRAGSLGAALLLLVGACGGAEPSRPFVLVYLIDTLRADHLAAYGYARDTSPHLDAFARESILFERAYAPASWTRPSVGSLFTGVFPTRHGAVGRDLRLRSNFTTLAELLADHGYATAAFVANPNLLPVFGFDRGFATFTDVRSVKRNADAEEVHRAALDFLDGARAGPHFLYVHTIDPHAPYEPPPPYDRTFRSDRPGIDRYDGEVAYADAEFGRFVAALRQRGLLDHSLVVVLSDHGEGLGEHGTTMHGTTLFEEQVRVPLLLRLPDGELAGHRVDEPVRILDVLPALADILGIEPPPGLDGASLLPLLRPGSGPDYVPLLYFEEKLEPHALRALIHGRHKLVHRTRPTRQVSLYDLAADPAEERDLAPERGRLRERLLNELKRSASWMSGRVTLECTSGALRGERAVLSGELEVVDGRLRAFEAANLEGEDDAAQNAARTRAEFSFALESRPNPIPGRDNVRDRDRVRFALAPRDAVFRLDFAGDSAPALQLGRPSDPTPVALPLEARGGDPRLRITSPPQAASSARRRAGCHLWSVPAPEPSEERIDIPPELDARLRALGYVDDP